MPTFPADCGKCGSRRSVRLDSDAPRVIRCPVCGYLFRINDRPAPPPPPGGNPERPAAPAPAGSVDPEGEPRRILYVDVPEAPRRSRETDESLARKRLAGLAARVAGGVFCVSYFLVIFRKDGTDSFFGWLAPAALSGLALAAAPALARKPWHVGVRSGIVRLAYLAAASGAAGLLARLCW